MSPSDQRARYNPQLWHYLNRFLIGVILLLVVVFGINTFFPVWNRRDDLRKQLAAEKSKLAAEELIQKQRTREVTLLQTDPEYVETIARDKLGVMKPGEIIYRLDGTKKPSATDAIAPAPPPR